QIVSIKNKHIPYGNISISHPEIQNAEKSREAKKYTYYSLNKNEKGKESFTLDEQADGSTEDFDFVQMNQINHEYTSVPSVKRIERGSAKQRLEEDANGQRYSVDHPSIRSRADSGGEELARGLEHQMLHAIKAQGAVQDFSNLLTVLEQYPAVKAIRAFID